jgi:hypothetical protein
MSAKKVLAVSAVVLVAVIYYYLYGDMFSRGTIPIHLSQRPRITRVRPGTARPAAPPVDLIFSLGQKYRLTEIEIFPLEALKTNQYPHPLWHLVSESNSAPVESFLYGRPVPGMHTAVKGAPAEPLSPSTGYRVLVVAGAVKGQHDFQTRAEDPPAQ